MLEVNPFDIFKNNEELSKNRKVIRLCFFTPTGFQDMVDSGYYPIRDIQTWKGYGNIREKYPF
jgi:hypothetical protein